MKVCWCDLETTGLECKRHGIWQAAFLIEIDGVVKDKKNFFMYPEGKVVEPGAEEMMKVSLQELKEAYPFAVFAKVMMRDFVKKYVDPFIK